MQSNIMFMYAIFIKCFFLIFHQNCGTSKISQSDKSCNSNLFPNKQKNIALITSIFTKMNVYANSLSVFARKKTST